MIDRVLVLKEVRIKLNLDIFNFDMIQAIVEITTGSNDLNLEKYQLTNEEWELLEDYREILQVFSILINFNTTFILVIRFLMHSRIFLVLKQLQLFVTPSLPFHLSFRDGKNFRKPTLTGPE
jgi:hypothetical protein